nr:hypothetical protein Iba_chr13dCG1580 [Ipomoea batatas]GMD80720.1 hypothetical protein Iba_chr13eCG4620 [Ipomoea batatas]
MVLIPDLGRARAAMDEDERSSFRSGKLSTCDSPATRRFHSLLSLRSFTIIVMKWHGEFDLRFIEGKREKEDRVRVQEERVTILLGLHT